MNRAFVILLSVVLILTMIPAGTVWAAQTTSGTTGDCTWTLDGLVLTISGNGKMRDYTYYESAPWWGKAITQVTIQPGVTNIGDYAFYGRTDLIDISIPNGIEQIGRYAFYGCTGLKELSITEDVKTIGEHAFYNCTGLETIYYHAKSDSVFSSSTDLFYETGTGSKGISLIIGDTVQSIPGVFFNALYSAYRPSIVSVTIGKNVTNIGTSAFSGWTHLKEITIAENVNTIGDKAFYNCTALEKVYYHAKNVPDFKSESDVFYGAGSSGNGVEVVFGDCVASIPAHLFDTVFSSHRPKINAVLFGKNIKTIGDYAFYGCAGITDIALPDGLTKIGERAFYECTGLKSVVIPNRVEQIADRVFYGCSGLTSVSLPDGLTSIGNYAFCGCTRLRSVDVPNSVTVIGDYAFDSCAALTDLSIGNSVKSIGTYAFEYCTNLMYVTIPDSVKVIGKNAFYHCTNLYSLTLGKNLAALDNDAFRGCVKLFEVINHSSLMIGQASINGYAGYYAKVIHADENSRLETMHDYVFYADENDCLLLGYVGGDTQLVLPDSYNGKPYDIAAYAFYQNGTLTNVTMPACVSSIGDYAFYDCSGLHAINISDRVSKIGSYAFYHCNSLGSIIIPNGVTKIESYTFYGCPALTNVTLGKSVREIGYSAFDGCSALQTITLAEETDWQNISISSNNSSLYLADLYAICQNGQHLYSRANDKTCNVCGEEREVTGTVPGDANGDGVADTADLVLIKKSLAGLVNAGELNAACDYDGNGTLDTADLVLLKKKLAGLIA